jgi:hypothetical protein
MKESQDLFHVIHKILFAWHLLLVFMDVHLQVYNGKGNFIQKSFTPLPVLFFKILHYMSGLIFTTIIYFFIYLFT